VPTGAGVILPPILLALEKDKPFKKLAIAETEI
jgi:hypothetical protein